MTDASRDGFQALVDPSLSAEGVKGSYAKVSIDGPDLRIEGSGGSTLRVAIEEMERLRVGVRTGRGGHQAMIWRRGRPQPLLVRLSAGRDGYAPAVRRLVGMVAASGGSGVLELGTSRRGAVFSLLLFAVQFLAFVGMAIHAYRNGLWWLALLFAAICLFVPFVFPDIVRREWPRPMRSPEELERMLPAPVPPARNAPATK